MTQRVQKWIAQSGLCSRRRAEELLREGRVTVDGEPAKPGDLVDGLCQAICVDGVPLRPVQRYVYLILNKPRGYTCSMSDSHAAHLVGELVSDCGERVYPVGRLDRDSEGLLLLTNDGNFAQALTHPRHQVDKVYEVTVSGRLNGCAARLSAVSELDGEPIRPAQVEVLRQTGGQAVLRMTIHQGKNRQIRRMCAQVGLWVKRLRRVQEHTLYLGDLMPGKWRYLTETELRSVLEITKEPAAQPEEER